MKKIITLILPAFVILTNQIHAQSVKKVVLNDKDSYSGSYLVVEPQSDSIAGALILIAGFGQHAEDTFPETKLQNVAYVNNILTVSFAAGNKLYADSITQSNLTAVIKDVLSKYKIDPKHFVLGGYSAGGMVALRYVELCNQYPAKFPVQPKAVFMVDSPIDIFTIWDQLEESYKNHYSEPAFQEAKYALQFIRNDYGVPKENPVKYSELTAFSMDKKYGENEKFLENTAVRAYHDVDIAWRLNNRNQTVHNSNYEITAELINRLLLMGNQKAEFMQTFKTGYRSNGNRHPHSWSIVDEVEFIQWMKREIR